MPLIVIEDSTGANKPIPIRDMKADSELYGIFVS